MADLLSGLVLIEGLTRLVPALLVLLVLFAVLEMTKALGNNTTVNVLISLCVGALVLVSKRLSYLISFTTPWIIGLLLFVLFIIILYKAMGATDGQIFDVLKANTGIVWLIGLIAVIIAAVGLGNIYGQDFLEKGYSSPGDDLTETEFVRTEDTTLRNQTDYQNNVTAVLFHPQVLGFGLIGLISTFTLMFMVK